jgi:mediator of RNA polymerase II transcription subunit 13
MSYELQSPASNASSYMNKNVNSVGAPTGPPEVHSLILNVFLSDSMVNLFKDQNFDSCPICVCNTNIKGADVGLYLTDRSAEAQYACTCGFSAVMNRKYGAAGSGLFYEDEVDITGLRDERLEQRKPSLLVAVKDVISGPDADKQLERLERVPPDIMLQLQYQFSSIFPSLTIKASYPSELSTLDTGNSATDGASWGISMLEKQDSCEACWHALEMGRQAVDHGLSAKLDDLAQKKNCMHPWPLLREYWF